MYRHTEGGKTLMAKHFQSMDGNTATAHNAYALAEMSCPSWCSSNDIHSIARSIVDDSKHL